MADNLKEVREILADPISLDECGGDEAHYAWNVVQWALSLAQAAHRAEGRIRYIRETGESPVEAAMRAMQDDT